MRYKSTGELHLDFHGATNTTINYIVDNFGETALTEIFNRVGKDVYKSIHQGLMNNDPSELIEHLDYSPGNILIQKRDEAYIFKIVDVNRMKFKATLSIDERMKNFDMLWAPKWALQTIAKEYAKIAGMDEKLLQNKILSYAFKLKLRKNFKKLLKGKIKNIDW